MVKKGVLVCTLLIVLLFISGCGESQVADVTEPKMGQVTQKSVEIQKENLTNVFIIVSKNMSVNALEDLKKSGLEIYSQTDNSITLSGEINVDDRKKLENNSEVKGIIKKSGGQTSSIEDQQLIDDARARLNITVGPYIEQEVWNEVQKNGRAYVGARFRIAGNYDTYQIYINEVKAKLTDKEKDSFEVLGVGRAFRVEISENSINQLKDYPNLLEIRLVRK